jgi:uncharacterized protein YukE
LGWDLERETQEAKSVWISDLEQEFDSLVFKIDSDIKNVHRCLDETEVSVASEKRRKEGL